MALAVDFDLNVTFGQIADVPSQTDATWDVSEWDSGQWAGASVTRLEWQSIGQLAYAAAAGLNVVSSGNLCRWKSTDISYTPGGLL